MGEVHGPHGKIMVNKSEHSWEQAATALDAAVQQIERIDGVISIHAQYAEPVAVMVVLVEDDAARQAVSELECQLSHGTENLALDLHVQRVREYEVEMEQTALSMAFSLLWSRN